MHVAASSSAQCDPSVKPLSETEEVEIRWTMPVPVGQGCLIVFGGVSCVSAASE